MPTNSRRAKVLYDGQCPLCLKSLEWLRALDWLHAFDYVNVRDAGQTAGLGVPLDQDRLLAEMHLVTPDGRHVYHGFRALRRMAWRLPLLWAFVPLLYVPGVPTVGQRLYLWVARHRFQLVPCHGGVCALPPRNDDGRAAG